MLPRSGNPGLSTTLFSERKNGIYPSNIALAILISTTTSQLDLIPLITPLLPGIPIAISKFDYL